MLKKLMKHELRATARIMLPLYLAILVLAVGTRLSSYWTQATTFQGTIGYDLAELMFALFAGTFAIALVGVFVVALVIAVLRFRSNLLGDEGYVMFTLPVTTHQLLWAKLLVSTIWFAGAALVDLLAIAAAFFEPWMLSEIEEIFWEMMQTFSSTPGLHLLLLGVEFLITCVLGCFCSCLMFYTPLAIGHSFDKHKMVLSVAFYFLIQAAIQVVSVMFMAFGLPFLDSTFFENWAYMNVETVLHGTMAVSILTSLATTAVFYFPTHYFLQKRLNLE